MLREDIDRLHLTLARDAPDAIIYADPRGRVFFWNAGAERIFGFSPEEAVGQSLDIIIPESLRRHHLRASLRHRLEEGRVRQQTIFAEMQAQRHALEGLEQQSSGEHPPMSGPKS
jgi:PAS domain S-box-containing protein